MYNLDWDKKEPRNNPCVGNVKTRNHSNDTQVTHTHTHKKPLEGIDRMFIKHRRKSKRRF